MSSTFTELGVPARLADALADNGMTVSQAPDWLIEKMKTIGGKMLVTWKESASPEAIEAVTPYFQAQGLE